MFRQKYLFLVFRLAFGFIFLWAFLDKLFGLGMSTAPSKAWILGTSPTYGFLANAKGVFSSVFQAMAGSPLVDVLFMAGLLGVSIALLMGIFVRLGSYGGALLMLLMWLSVIPLKNNPFVDDHIIYAVLLLMYAQSKDIPYSFFGAWKQLRLVKKHTWLA